MRMTNRPMTMMLGVLATISVGWFLHQAQGILQPLVIAMLLAIMLQPVVLGLRRYRVPPVVTVIGLVVLTFFGLARLGMTMQESIVSYAEGVNLAEEERNGEQGTRPLRGWPAVTALLKNLADESELPPKTIVGIKQGIDEFNEGALVTESIGTFTGLIKGLFLVVIYMLFIFAEQTVFRRKILVISGDREDDARVVLESISRGIQKYLGVKTVVSLATAATCYLGLILLDVPFTLLFAFVTFLLNYIPTFGSIIAGIFPTLTALAMSTYDGGELDATKAILVATLYMSANAFFGTFLEPRVLGRELNLSPLVVLVSVVAWAGIWGVPGTFLAVPLTSSIQIILANFETTRPIAVLLSSGPPKEKEPKPKRLKVSRRERAAAAVGDPTDSTPV